LQLLTIKEKEDLLFFLGSKTYYKKRGQLCDVIVQRVVSLFLKLNFRKVEKRRQ